MKKTLSILLIIISFKATAQDSTVIRNLSLQARYVEYFAVQISNIENDSLYTTFLDLRAKFRATKPTGSTAVIIDSIPTVELANLYNYTLSNSDGLGISKDFKTQIATARSANSFLNRLCTAFEDSFTERLRILRVNGRRVLLGKN